MKIHPFTIEISQNEIAIIGSGSSPKIKSRELISPSVKPALKWAGGKQWLVPAASYLTPEDFKGRYYEPFLGGGAFFFALEPLQATLSDRNEPLIAAYNALRNDVEGVIRLLRSYPYDRDFYYKIREKEPRSKTSIAARLLYLNRTCWNGLYRVNQKGKFNTPFGRFTNPTICDPERLRLVSHLLRRAKLRAGDFRKVSSQASAGDFVYFDPPYITGHQKNGFLKYNAALFSWNDQLDLAQLAINLAKSGVSVLVSNAEQESVIKLYKNFHYYKVKRNSLIGSNDSSRHEIFEALLSSYPILGCESKLI